jgi:tape measure domain-containing protein
MAFVAGNLQAVFSANLAPLQLGITRAQTLIQGFGANVNRSIAGIQNSFRGLAGIAAGLGVVLGTRALIGIADEAIELGNALRVVTKDAEELNAAFGLVRSVARETRTSISDVATLFRRLSISTQGLGVSQRELGDLTRTIARAVAASGATAREASNGIIQLAQGFALGTLQGQNLRSVLESLPVLAIALARGVEVPFGQLRQLAEQGQLTTARALQALGSQGVEIAQLLTRIQPSISSAFTVVRNEITATLLEFNLATSAITDTAGGVLSLADQTRSAVLAVISGVTRGVATALRTFADLAEGADDIGISLNSLRAAGKAVFAALVFAAKAFGTGLVTIRLFILKVLVALEKLQAAFAGPDPAADPIQQLARDLNDAIDRRNRALETVQFLGDAPFERPIDRFLEEAKKEVDRLTSEFQRIGLDPATVELDVSVNEQALREAENQLVRSADGLSAGFGGAASAINDALLAASATSTVDNQPLVDGLRAAADQADRLAEVSEQLRRTGFQPPELSDVVPEREDPGLTPAQNRDRERLLALETRINIELGKRTSTLESQRDAIRAQVAEIQKLVANLGESRAGDDARLAAANSLVLLLERERELTRNIADIQRELQAGPEGRRAALDTQIEQLRALSPERAQEIAGELTRALQGGIGDALTSEETVEVLRRFGVELSNAIQEELESRVVFRVGDAIRDSVTEGFRAGFDSAEAIIPSFAESLNRAVQDALSESLSNSLTTALRGTQGQLTGIARSIGNVITGQLGDTLFGPEVGPATANQQLRAQLFSTAVLGTIGAVTSAVLNRQEDAQITARNIQSAVTSAQQVRGIVAGPTQIAVAQVARGIQDAFVESERLLRIIATNTAVTAVNTGGRTGQATTDLAAEVLATESPSFV